MTRTELHAGHDEMEPKGLDNDQPLMSNIVK